MALIINDPCHRRIYQILLYFHLVRYYKVVEGEDFYETFEAFSTDKCEGCGKEKFVKNLKLSYDGEEKTVCVDCDE